MSDLLAGFRRQAVISGIGQSDIGRRLYRAPLDLTIDATTDRRAGLSDCDAILSSYRPGGFAARVLDERIPLKHGIIGQETQGPGGFFMALRAIHAMQGILSDVEDRCPKARIFNYTNPVNVLVTPATTDAASASSTSLRRPASTM